MRFKWIEWNRAHIARHGVAAFEAEQVVRSTRSRHFVRRDGVIVTRGWTDQGRRLFVVWHEEESTDIFADIDPEVFVITAYEVI